VIAIRAGDLAVFIFGFAKKDRDDIGPSELEDLKMVAEQWLGDWGKVEKDLAAGIFMEVRHDWES